MHQPRKWWIGLPILVALVYGAVNDLTPRIEANLAARATALIAQHSDIIAKARIEVHGRDMLVGGLTLTDKQSVFAKLRADPGLRSLSDATTTLSAAHPFALSLSRRGDQAALSGHVPLTEEKEKLVARLLAEGLSVEDLTSYASGAPAAFDTLADFAADRPALLARLACEATPEQYRILYPLLADEGQAAEVRGTLAQTVREQPGEGLSEAERVQLGSRRAGAAITLVFVTGRPETDAARLDEARAAADRLGARPVFLGAPARALKDDAALADRLAAELARLLEETRPEHVLVPFCLESHSDHRAAAAMTARALAGLSGRPLVWSYEVVTSGLVPGNVMVDITAVETAKAELIGLYASQTREFDYVNATLGLNRYHGRHQGGRGAGEVFLRLPAAEFAALADPARPRADIPPSPKPPKG